jgi:hypothetical protein
MSYLFLNIQQRKEVTLSLVKVTVERLKLKKYENEARLVFSLMKIGKDDIRLKWKNWEMFVLCIFIYENR